MEFDALRYGLALLVLTVALVPILPISETRATVAIEPTDGSWEQDDYVATDSLSPECQRLAHDLAAGTTVREVGYRFSVIGTDVIVKQTNVTGGWHRGDSICLARLTERNRVRIDGQIYELSTYSLSEGPVTWLHTGWFFGFFASLVLCLLGVSKRRNW